MTRYYLHKDFHTQKENDSSTTDILGFHRDKEVELRIPRYQLFSFRVALPVIGQCIFKIPIILLLKDNTAQLSI